MIFNFQISFSAAFFIFFFFNDPPPTEIYPLSLHNALPILSLTLSPQPSCLPSTSSHRARKAARKSPAIYLRHSVIISSRMPARFVFVMSSRRGSRKRNGRSEEHTPDSSHLGISYTVFCLKK